MRRNLFICLLLAGITLAIYWPARHYDCIYFDDSYFINETPEINAGLSWHSLAWAFTGVVLANWHPATSLTFLLTHQFWGANPGVEHLVNAVIHALNAALLFLVLTQMMSLRHDGPQQPHGSPPRNANKTVNAAITAMTPQADATWRSAVVAAIFAWHPLRVESVAWIAERKDVLCGFFFLLTLWAYARYAEKSKVHSPESKVFYGLALVFFALALMSKPMAVTLPFVLLLLDFWPLARVRMADGGWRVTGGERGKPSTLNRVKGRDPHETLRPQLSTLVFEKWPFFALAFGVSALAFWLQQTQAAISDFSKVPPDFRLANAVASYLKYLGKTVWPTDLAVIYPHPVDSFTSGSWPGWEVAAGGLVLAGISVLCWQRLTREPWLAVGWFWFLGMMVPVIGIVQVGEQAMADRYTYLPLIGPVIGAVWQLSKWLRTPRFQLPLAMVCAAGLAGLTMRQLGYWQNSILLFNHCIAVTGANPTAEFCLASGYKSAGETNAALTHYRISLALNPNDNQARNQIGLVLMTGGHWAEAEALFDETLLREPGDYFGHISLGQVLSHLGRQSEAIAQLEAALKNKPDGVDALNNLAWTLATCPDANIRDGGRAVQLAERACELTHDQKTVIVGTLAAAYAEAGRFDDAIATAQKACALAAESGETNLLQKNQELLDRYRQHQTARE
jgi:tetratricopeptide (TPR) repeat protein